MSQLQAVMAEMKPANPEQWWQLGARPNVSGHGGDEACQSAAVMVAIERGQTEAVTAASERKSASSESMPCADY